MTNVDRRARIRNIERLLSEMTDLDGFAAELLPNSAKAVALNDASTNQLVSLSVELWSGRKTYILNDYGRRFLELSETEREAEPLILLS